MQCHQSMTCFRNCKTKVTQILPLSLCTETQGVCGIQSRVEKDKGRQGTTRVKGRSRLSCNLHNSGYVHTNPFSYASVLYPTKTDTNIRVHTSVFESFSTVHTSCEKTIRFRSPWETDYLVHDVSVFENIRLRNSPP